MHVDSFRFPMYRQSLSLVDALLKKFDLALDVLFSDANLEVDLVLLTSREVVRLLRNRCRRHTNYSPVVLTG